MEVSNQETNNQANKTTSKNPSKTKVVFSKKPKEVTPQSKEAPKKTFQKRKQSRNTKPASALPEGFADKVIKVSRVTKVVKGGKRFSFNAFVVVGNKNGKVGLGHGKANEVQDAIKKAQKNALKNIIVVPIVNTTIPHEVNFKFLATKLLLKPSKTGKGLIASGSVRSVIELAGISNIVTKVYGSRTSQNVAKAAILALQSLKTAQDFAQLRDIPVAKLINLKG